VFDLDGTLANIEHRLPLIEREEPDWHTFFAACPDDTPIERVCKLCRDLADKHAIVIISGRSTECRAATEIWLDENRIPYDALYMRKEEDRRPDTVIKPELLKEMLDEGWEPTLFIDDRRAVVDMWRAMGYTCLQCAPGDF
jgi:hypothetical protein